MDFWQLPSRDAFLNVWHQDDSRVTLMAPWFHTALIDRPGYVDHFVEQHRLLPAVSSATSWTPDIGEFKSFARVLMNSSVVSGELAWLLNRDG